MNTQTAPINSREHSLSVAIAKMVFYHPRRGIVFVREPISRAAAANYGLQPLILYALAPAGTALRYLTYTLADRPSALTSVLFDAWRRIDALRGPPDVLRVNRHVATACVALPTVLAEHGVLLAVADGNDKAFAAALRSAQNDTLEIGWGIRDKDPPIYSLDDLNVAAERCLAAKVSHRSWQYRHERNIVDSTEAWLALEQRQIPTLIHAHPNWTSGPWLHTWETNLLPESSRYLFDDQRTRWLLSGEQESTGDSDNEVFSSSGDDPIDNLASKSKLVADMWPGGVSAIAQSLGIAVRDLRWFLSEKAPLATLSRHRLQSILGVEYKDEYGEYEALGPCVLIASGRKIIEAYDELSQGGDLDFAFEALPTIASADPSWRYLIFQACGGLPNIIMFPRGSKLGPDNKKHFINLEEPRHVPDDLYRDVVRTATRACQEPSANITVMMDFARRNMEALEEYKRQW